MSTARPDTWMPLYIGDYLADTGRLSTAQHGAYILLIMDYWRAGPPPDDDVQLAAVTRQPVREWQKMRPAIARFFQITGGAWNHKRVDEERGRAHSISAARKASGKQGGKQKQSNRVANGLANGLANDVANGLANAKRTPTPLPSPSPRKSSEVKETSDGEPSLEVRVFRQGKRLLGQNAGGQITKLRQALAFDDAAVMALFDEAGAKENPAEWVAGVLRNHAAAPPTDALGLPVVAYTAAMIDEEYRRLGVQS